MRAIVSGVLSAVLLYMAAVALAAAPAAAQAPSGPATGAPPQKPVPPVQAPPAQEPQPGGVSIAVEVPVVTLDVVATTSHGDIITNLNKENFRVAEDGVPQTITSFGPTDAPITMVVLMEFSARYYSWFAGIAKYWTDALFPSLKPQDWVALVTFDMKPKLEVDFTQNKEEVRQAVYRLYFPGFSESNVFDALLDTLDRLKDVKGKKSILLICTGVDTFSKHTLDQTIKQVRQTDVTIFAVGVDRPVTNYLEAHGALGNLSRMDFYQGENQLRTFAKETGGYAWFPQFDGELPGIFRDVAAFLRNQYTIAYTPTNRARDGKFRKVKIELVAPDGSPLVVKDQKGKKLKYVVYAREGYIAPKGID